MSADPAHRRQLGELLVEKGILTDAQLQVALEEQQRSGAPLGETLVALGFIQGPTIGNALAEQHGGPLRTEYGLAMGPTQVLGMPPKQADQSNDRGLAGDASRLRVARPTREQDTAIASLTASLNERTQELDRLKTDLADLQQQGHELASAADLQTLQNELTEAREERTRAEQALGLAVERNRAELATMNLELAQAHKERAQHDSRAQKLEQELEQAHARNDDTADTERAQNKLRLALRDRQADLVTAKSIIEALQLELAEANDEQMQHVGRTGELEQQLAEAQLDLEHHKAELATARARLETLHAGLAEANEEQTRHANRANELESRLEQARTEHDETADLQHSPLELQHALVAAARERAQRGYGPPLRKANTDETGREENGNRDPLRADDRGGETEMPRASGITIKLWQLALFIALAPVLLYTLAPISAPLAAAAIVLLAATMLIHGRRASLKGKSAPRHAADRPTDEVFHPESPASSDRPD
jgi:DNA repair exonuclease SbcCD ATPase subunit